MNMTKSIHAYEVWDGEQSSGMSIRDELPVYYSDTAKGAILTMLAETGRNYYKIKRSAKNDVVFSATQFEDKDGRRYKRGNQIWYAVIGRD